jgi:hypothetical protein
MYACMKNHMCSHINFRRACRLQNGFRPFLKKYQFPTIRKPLKGQKLTASYFASCSEMYEDCRVDSPSSICACKILDMRCTSFCPATCTDIPSRLLCVNFRQNFKDFYQVSNLAVRVKPLNFSIRLKINISREIKEDVPRLGRNGACKKQTALRFYYRFSDWNVGKRNSHVIWSRYFNQDMKVF